MIIMVARFVVKVAPTSWDDNIHHFDESFLKCSRFVNRRGG